MILSNKDWIRFWSKVDKSGSCWLWMHSTDDGGYGLFRLNRRLWKAHILSFLQAGNKLKEGQLVLHECDRPRCVNPKCLFAGTHADNAQDREHKGRGVIPHQVGATFRKVNEDLTLVLKAEYSTGTCSLRALALKYGLSYTAIRDAIER